MGRPAKHTIDVATPERLLASAESVFAERGFERATLEEIARRAGISRPSLLYHFASKDQLLRAVLERSFAALGEMLLSRLNAPIGREAGALRSRLIAVVDAFTTFVDVHPALARLVVRSVIGDDDAGRALVRELGVPLLDEVVAYVEGAEATPSTDPPVADVRAALMHLVSDTFLRAAAGELAPALWGKRDARHLVVDALFPARTNEGA